MIGRSKYLIKNVGILTVSNFASKILVFLLVPIYTSVLSTEDVGIYDLVVSTVSLLYPILTMNIVDGVMRFSMDRSKSVDEIISVGLRYIALSWIVGGFGLLIIRALRLIPQIEGLEFIIFLYYAFYIFHNLLQQFAKGLERVVDMGIAGVIATVTMIGGNIFFLLVIREGIKGLFLAYTLAQIVPTVYLFVRLKFWQYLGSFSINKGLRKEMLLYSTPLIATTLGWWVNNASDKYVVAFICGAGANGLLAVSYKIPQILNTLQGIFIQAWQISAIKEYEEGDSADFYGRTFLFINTLMSAACSWLIILSKPLAHILYQKDFYVSWQYVPFLLLASVLNSASGFLGPILSAKKASKPMAMSAVYGASVNVVLNILLVYLIGIQGATIATVVSSFIIYMIRKKAVGNEICIKEHGKILLTWGLLCVQAALEIYSPFWWAEVIIMVVMLLLNWSEVKGIFNLSKSILRRKE